MPFHEPQLILSCPHNRDTACARVAAGCTASRPAQSATSSEKRYFERSLVDLLDLNVYLCWWHGDADTGPDTVLITLGQEGGVSLVHFSEVLIAL